MNCKYILTQNKILELKVKYITSDGEYVLYNAINAIFPEQKLILCYFHYKYDIHNYMNNYGLLEG